MPSRRLCLPTDLQDRRCRCQLGLLGACRLAMATPQEKTGRLGLQSSSRCWLSEPYIHTYIHLYIPMPTYILKYTHSTYMHTYTDKQTSACLLQYTTLTAAGLPTYLPIYLPSLSGRLGAGQGREVGMHACMRMYAHAYINSTCMHTYAYIPANIQDHTSNNTSTQRSKHSDRQTGRQARPGQADGRQAGRQAEVFPPG